MNFETYATRFSRLKTEHQTVENYLFEGGTIEMCEPKTDHAQDFKAIYPHGRCRPGATDGCYFTGSL